MHEDIDAAEWLRSILATRPLTAREVLSRLTADTTGPPDLVQGLRRLIETLSEEATTHEIVHDPEAWVEAFLEEHPHWRQQGFTRLAIFAQPPTV